MPMRTAEQALIDCLALGTDRETCDGKVRSQMVGGTYCDGTIVMVAGSPPRCVQAAVRDAKLAAAVVPGGGPSTRAAGDVRRPWVLPALVVGAAALAFAVWLTEK